MDDFAGKVAVVTGATQGIGRGIANRCIAEGMKVVLVGRNKEALTHFQDEVREQGGTALAVATDVSQYDQVDSLARQTLEAYGAVHLLVNNAGLAGLEDMLKPIWEVPLAEWEQTLSVNLWGVIYGIHAFIPIMLEQNDACHVVNVASINGLCNWGIMGAYGTTKHGVVSLSESLQKGLQARKANIKITVACPGKVSTDIVGNIVNSWRESSRRSMDDWDPEKQEWLHNFEQQVKDGMKPAEFTDLLFEAIRKDQFYVLTHPRIKDGVRERMEDIIAERNPGL